MGLLRPASDAVSGRVAVVPEQPVVEPSSSSIARPCAAALRSRGGWTRSSGCGSRCRRSERCGSRPRWRHHCTARSTRRRSGRRPRSSRRSGTVPGDVTPAAMDEDCLFLNVWAPTEPGPHPVFVWFYGGGFLSGATSDPTIDGARLAARGSMVVVTIAYRVGALGFLGLGDTNCGLRDQACGLEWVRDHIAAFGGDANNVTIAGESAGGGSVLHLLAAPGTDGLFRRAIIQSGATEYTRTRAEVGTRHRDLRCRARRRRPARGALAPHHRSPGPGHDAVDGRDGADAVPPLRRRRVPPGPTRRGARRGGRRRRRPGHRDDARRDAALLHRARAGRGPDAQTGRPLPRPRRHRRGPTRTKRSSEPTRWTCGVQSTATARCCSPRWRWRTPIRDAPFGTSSRGRSRRAPTGCRCARATRPTCPSRSTRWIGWAGTCGRVRIGTPRPVRRWSTP